MLPPVLKSYPKNEILHQYSFKTPELLAKSLINISEDFCHQLQVDFIAVKCSEKWMEKIKDYLENSDIMAKIKIYPEYLLFHMPHIVHDQLAFFVSDKISNLIKLQFPSAEYTQAGTSFKRQGHQMKIKPDSQVISEVGSERNESNSRTVPNLAVEVGNSQKSDSLGTKTRDWFKLTNDLEERVGVCIVVKLIYDDYKAPMLSCKLDSVIFTAILLEENEENLNKSISRRRTTLKTNPPVNFGLISHATAQVNLTPRNDPEKPCAAIGDIVIAKGLGKELTIPQASLLNGDGDDSEFTILPQRDLIKLAQKAYADHEEVCKDFRGTDGTYAATSQWSGRTHVDDEEVIYNQRDSRQITREGREQGQTHREQASEGQDSQGPVNGGHGSEGQSRGGKIKTWIGKRKG